MSANHNLLYGMLAMQLNLIGADEFRDATETWKKSNNKSLRDILLEQRRLTEEQLKLIDSYFGLNLEANGDVEKSLHSLATVARAIDDPDVQASMHGAATITRNELTQSRNGTSRAHYPEPVRDGSRYQIKHFHKDGGLGKIYVAEDLELHREVALKEIKPERADDRASQARFVFEAETTAKLDHPGIVPVHGFGIYPDGRPYYAMRFIRGGSLKEAIDRLHTAAKSGEAIVTLRQLLRRFIDVCNAVAYAHSRGVLHRDIKPDNIMLGSFGETLVVDWGIAKTGIEPKVVDPNSDATADPVLRPSLGTDPVGTTAGAIVGTPHYMSPEQAAGRINDLSPASDIYSLGVTLYVLLTGQRPFEGIDANVVLKLAEQGNFAPPKHVKAEVPAALDAICVKAMAIQPSDRYATALALAADVEHWLADEPVKAYRDPLLVRAGRWARRHRTPVVAVAVFLLSAVVGLGASTALIYREQLKTDEQRKKAEERKSQVEQNYVVMRDLSSETIGLIEAAEAQFAAIPALDRARKKILIATAKAYRQLLEAAPEDTELRKKAAQVFRYTANVHRLTHEIDEAEPLYRDSISLYERLATDFPDEVIYQVRVSETLRDYSKLQSNAGRLREATDTLGRSIDVADKLPDDHPKLSASSKKRAKAAALLGRSTVAHLQGLYQEAADDANQAAGIYRGLLVAPEGQRHPYDPVLLAAAINAFAMAERDLDRLDAARKLHADAVEILKGLLDTKPVGVNRADLLHFVSLLQVEQSRTWAKNPNDFANAIKNLSSPIAVWGKLVGFNNPMYREAMGIAFRIRGQLKASDLNRLKEARTDLEESHKLLEQVVNETPLIPGSRGDLGRTCLELGRLTRKEGNEAEAKKWFAKASEVIRDALTLSPDNHEDQQSLVEVTADQMK